MCLVRNELSFFFRMEYVEQRGESEVEADSDHEDMDGGGDGGWLGHPLHNFHTVSKIKQYHLRQTCIF